MHFAQIAPVLAELDELCPLNKGVLIHAHLIPLFKKHGNLDEIILVPRPSSSEILGLSILNAQERKMMIVHKACSIHDPDDVEPTCPDCQMMRYVIAKELVHALDEIDHRTPPTDATRSLIDQLLRKAWTESDQASADGFGTIWAGELLMRFRCRAAIQGGGGGLAPSFLFTQARANDDYSIIAKTFCVPSYIARHMLGDSYMKMMKDIREKLGLLTAYHVD